MIENIHVSGFSDEISSDFIEQLEHVTKLGMSYISIRGVDKRNINDYTIEEINDYVKPTLEKYKVSISSIGSPIGKVFIDDEEGFIKQKEDLHRLCEIANILGTKYIRIFSFYIPKDEEADAYRDNVISKLKEYVTIAAKYDVILLHENEKDIFGTGDGNIKEILKDLISKGYQGFLTLEPHLVMFDSLQDLELEAAEDVIKADKAKDGAEGYQMQYDALLEILKEIEGEI